jgi:hypothetical protein
MSHGDIFKDKSIALIVQGILLFIAIIYSTHGGPNIFVVLSIVTLLSLYILQAINHRFRYYFPINTFFQVETKKVDTYILYLLTFVAFFFFLTGITHSIILGFSLSIIILSPGPLWYFYVAKHIALDIQTDFKKKDPVVSYVSCQFCGGEAIQVASFISGNKAIAIGKCVKGCGQKFEKDPQIVNFG